MENSNNTDENLFISGASDAGLCIAAWKDQTYDFTTNEQVVKVIQTVDVNKSGLKQLSLLFKTKEPVRFSLEILIPDDADNACVMLNEQVLIMPMNTEWPEDLMPLQLSACQQKGEAVSTLRAGEFQKINFRWHNGDNLTVYCV